MKILFTSARPFLPSTYFYGATRTAGSLLAGLSRRGHECTVISELPLRISRRWLSADDVSRYRFCPPELAECRELFQYRWRGVEVLVARHRKAFNAAVRGFLEPGRDRPDVVWAELEGSGTVLRRAKREGLPSFLFVKDLSRYARRCAPNAERDTSEAFCATRFVSQRLERTWPGRIHRVGEAVEPEAYRTRSAGRSGAIGMVNPVRLKGGAVFHRVAEALPAESFLAVLGWPPFGTKPYPAGIGKRPLPNVEVLPPQEDMRRVYSRLGILLVPSQWEEAFGRVIVEAMLNGIPVIASRVAGIPEVLGDAGLLIDEPKNIEAWKRGIARLRNDPRLYRRCSNRGKARAKRFFLGTSLPGFEKALRQVVASR